MAPNIFEIIKNGKLIDQNAANKDYQDILENNYLRMNYKTFKQVVILGSASFTPFMQLAAQARREIIEDLLDIQIFSVMNVLLKEKLVNNTKELTEIDHKLEVVIEKIKLNDNHIKSISEDTNERKSIIQGNIKRSEESIVIEYAIINENLDKIKVLEPKIKKLDVLIEKSSKIASLENQIKEKLLKAKHDHKFYSEHDNCPVCTQIIDKTFKDTVIAKNLSIIEKSNNAISTILSEHSEIKSNINKLEIIKKDILDLKTDNRIRQNKIESINIHLSELNIEITKLEKRIRTDINQNNVSKELEIDRDKISQEKKRLFEIREIYKTSAIILKDNGIKSKIIKQYIPIINKLINKYLASMEFFVQFELNETFNEIIKSRYRDEYSYESFSEGEKFKIDLALLFTWRMISKMRNSASTNILIMDEIMDSSLDANSVENLLKILNEMSDTNIFVISHNSEIKDKEIFKKVYQFEKRQNFSTMIEV